MLTTHYMEEAEELCDRVAIVDHGRLLELDTPTGLVRALDAPTRIKVETSALTQAEASQISGVEQVDVTIDSIVLTTREPGAVLAALADRNALEGLSVSGANLEDVFLRHTGREYRS